MRKTKLIKQTKDIDSAFKLRLYNFLHNNFKEDSLFYNKNYYRDIASFCDDNNIYLNISEYLALNFYFFAKNRTNTTAEYLTQYLKIEKNNFDIQFLSSHISRAKLIVQSLIQLDNNERVTTGYEKTALKIKDILNIFYSYCAEEFEALAKAKMFDDHRSNAFLVDLDEVVMSNFLSLKNKPKIYQTEKFHSILESFAQKNIEHILHYNTKETHLFEQMRKRLN